MHDPSIMIIEKDFVIIEARLKQQQQQQQKSGSYNGIFVLQKDLENLPITQLYKISLTIYLLLNILFYTEYTHHFLMPNAATIKSS